MATPPPHTVAIRIDLNNVVEGLSRSHCEMMISLCQDRLKMMDDAVLTDEEKDLVDNGHRVRAIRNLRVRTGVRLYDAWDIVDKYCKP